MSDLTNVWRGRFQYFLSVGMRWLGRHRFDPADFEIVRQRLPVAGLNAAFDGFRLVHISDLHIGHWLTVERWHGVVDLINELEPDLIAITGDFVSYVLAPLEADLTAGLGALQAGEGVVAVLGNHDHWLDPDGVRRVFQRSGVKELNNDVVTLVRGDGQLHIAGVDDVIAGQPQLEKVLKKLPPNGPALLLAHEPDFADESAATGRFFLQLSGHSHGTQIVLPGKEPFLRGPGFTRYPLGRYEVEDMVQYTNRGLGTHVVRLRINCAPEITEFTFFMIE